MVGKKTAVSGASKDRNILDRSVTIIRQRPFLASFMFVTSLFTLGFVFFTPFFHVDDDVTELMFAKGVGHALQPDPHLIYPNILIGHALEALYFLFPKFSWYAAGLSFLEFLGFWAFLYGAYLNGGVRWLKNIFFFIYALFIGIYFFTSPNFTMAPILAVHGGVFLLVRSVGEKGPVRNKAIGLGSLCVMAAPLFRLESFFLALITAIPFLFDQIGVPRLRFRARPLIYVVPLFILFASLFDKACYQFDPEWKGSMEFLHSICVHHEWRPLVYDPRTKPSFDSAEWSLNDFRMYESLYFWDPGKYNPEILGKLGALSPWASLEGKAGSFSLGGIFHSYLFQNMALCFLVFLLFCPRGRVVWILANAAWVFGWLFFLIYFMKAPERVFLPLCSFLVLSTIYYSEPSLALLGGKKMKYTLSLAPVALIAGLFILSIPAVRYYHATNRSAVELSEGLKRSIQGLNPSDQQLYMVWGGSLRTDWIKAYDDFEIFRNFHLFGIGSFQRSPVAKGMLAHFGIKNPLRDAVDNPNVFIICSPAEGAMYAQYMKENFDMKILGRKVFQCPFFSVFDIHSVP